MHRSGRTLRYGLRMLAKHPGFYGDCSFDAWRWHWGEHRDFFTPEQILLRQLPVKNPGELSCCARRGRSRANVWSDGDDSQIFSYPFIKAGEKYVVFDGVIARYSFPQVFLTTARPISALASSFLEILSDARRGGPRWDAY